MEKKGMHIIGLAVETTNQGGQAMRDLGELWQRFIQENIPQKIVNKVNNCVYCIYTDYESDYTGNYTAIIGVAVNSLERIPTGLVGRTFEGGNFLIYEAIGEMPQAVGEVWNNIWSKDAALNRLYTYDYEVYGENEKGVNIYIAV